MSKIEKVNAIPVETENSLPTNIDEISSAMKLVAEENKKRRKKKTSNKNKKIREGKGGQNFYYVDRLAAQSWLDEHYPVWEMKVLPDSLFVIDDTTERGRKTGTYNIAVELTVKDPNTAVNRTITCYGSKEFIINKEGEKTQQAYFKSAETDAFKRCVYTLGAFADVYKPEDEVEDYTSTEMNIVNNVVLNVLPELLKLYEIGKVKEVQVRNVLSKVSNSNVDQELLNKWINAINDLK
jgi:hypothetical protein